MAQLTKMQQKIYDYIVQAIQDQGYPPRCGRSARPWGWKSPSTGALSPEAPGGAGRHRQAGRERAVP